MINLNLTALKHYQWNWAKQVMQLVWLFSVGIGTSSYATINVDSTLNAIEQQPIELQDSLRNKFIRKLKSSNMDRAYDLALETLKRTEDRNDSMGIYFTYQTLGLLNNNMGVYDSAVYYDKQAIEMAKKISYEEGVGIINHNLSSVYSNQGNYVEAIECLMLSTTLFEKYGDFESDVKGYVNMATIHSKLGNDSIADANFHIALFKSHALNDSALLGATYTSYGMYLAQHGQLDSAMKYMKISMRIREKEQRLEELFWNYNNIGGVYFYQEDLKNADYYFNKSYELAVRMNAIQGQATALGNLGSLQNEVENYGKALEYHQKALQLGMKSQFTNIVADALDNISMAYENQGDYKNALRFKERFMLYSDSILNTEKTKQIAEMQTRFETVKKEKENAELKAENVVKQTELSQEQNARKRNLVFSGIAFLLIVLTFLTIFYRRKLNETKRLEQLEKERFKAVMDAEENERTRIAKELHDGLGQILSTAKLNVAALEGNVETDDEILVNNSMQLMDQAVSEVRSISHNLMPVALMKLGVFPAIRELVEKINDSGKVQVLLTEDIKDQKLETSTEVALYRIVQEVIHNMLTHSKATKIQLSIVANERQIDCTISDNGVGFDTSKIDQSKGLGWRNIFSRVSLLNGKIKIQSEKGSGTHSEITVPVVNG